MFVSNWICKFNLISTRFNIYLLIYISNYCFFFPAVIVYLISVRFGFHFCLNSKIFLFVLSLICISNISFTRFEIYLFSYISTSCIFFYDCLFNFCSFLVSLILY